MWVLVHPALLFSRNLDAAHISRSDAMRTLGCGRFPWFDSAGRLEIF